MHDEKTSSIESFIKRYLEAIGGMWDEVEPQVYDVLMPPGSPYVTAIDEDILRLAFDPEALPEHPNAELITYGAPLFDSLLEDSQKRFSFARTYLLTGFHLPSFDIERRIRRELRTPDDTNIRFNDIRPLHFANALFWFRATFMSDQKEQDLFSVAIDLHYGRQARHLSDILSTGSLTETKAMPYPDASRIPLMKSYQIALSSIVGTVGAVANIHKREMDERLQTQIARMTQYYNDLHEEMKERIERAEQRDSDTTKLYDQLGVIDRERKIRINELKNKAVMRVEIELLSLMILSQPKLHAQVDLVPKKGTPGSTELVWDPLTEKLEAAECPNCKHPTFSLSPDLRGGLVCQDCSQNTTSRVLR
jgi:hypothetical protein